MSYSLNYSNLFTQTQKHKRQNYFKASRGTKKNIAKLSPLLKMHVHHLTYGFACTWLMIVLAQ